MIVTYIHSNNPEDEFRVQLRCRNFADAINRFGWHSANLLDLNSFTTHTPNAHRICSASDLLVIHRYLYGPVLQAIEYWKARDKKVIVDIDQAINHLTPEIPSHSFWVEGAPLVDCPNADTGKNIQIDPAPLEQFKWGLGLIDAAIVPSTRLMIDWSQFTNVYEIPDYLNSDQYPAFKQEHGNEIWIGLANGTRVASIKNSGLLDALKSICQKRPKLRIIVCDSEDIGRFLEVTPSQMVVYPSYVFEEWASMLLKLDIGLVPIHGDFELRLGRINLLEFMISKIPWIASNQPSFRELSRYGSLIQNSSEAWEVAILNTIDNIDSLRKCAAGEPFLFALSQDVNENIDKVLRLFTCILNRA